MDRKVPEARMRKLRRDMQMIFQDSVASLNPRRPVKEIVVEGLAIGGAPETERTDKAGTMLKQVGLGDERLPEMLPRRLSGGQAQRVAIARADADPAPADLRRAGLRARRVGSGPDPQTCSRN